MSYGTVVNELARKLEHHIIAFDNLPDHGGCILYMDGPVKRVDIEIAALAEGVDKLAAFVEHVLVSTPRSVGRVCVGMRNGDLAVVR